MKLQISPLSLLLLSLLISSCGGGGSSSHSGGEPAPEPNSIPEPTGLLVVVDSPEQLLESVKSGFANSLSHNREVVLTVGGPEPGAPLENDSAGQFTTTYTQEANVDEHDAVKYDGEHLFIAPSRGLGCCFAMEPALGGPAATDGQIAPSPEPVNRAVRILATDPDTAYVTEAGSIPVADDKTVEGLFVDDELLVTITSTAWWGYYGPAFERVEHWAEQSTGLSIYDVSSVSEPGLSWEIEIEGGFVTSRKVGDTVYLISRHSPAVEQLVYYPQTDEEGEENQTLIDALTIEDIIPNVLTNGKESALFDPEDCLVLDAGHDLAPSERGFPVLTTIIAIDLKNPGIIDKLCYSEASNGTYVSEQAIYLTQNDYNNGATPQTIVHRFAYAAGLEYSGSGKVKGDLRTGGNLDFRISESGDYLRLVTSTWTGTEEDRFEHFLHVLSPSPDTIELEQVAVLPSAASPEPIGKPNEDLYGVRFLGDRAYLVTFERIDPLYVIDLSNHLEPHIAGELEITGFSDFLHPVSEALLLGLGRGQEGAVKLELFDISELSAPRSLGALSLPEAGKWSYSEATYNRHAFTYQPDVGGVDRFAVPVNSSFSSSDEIYTWEDRLYLLEIRGKTDPATASLVEVGHISATPPAVGTYGGDRSRAIFHGDAVFYVQGEGVWSALWSAPFIQQGPK